MSEPSGTTPEFERAAKMARLFGLLACPVGAFLVVLAIGFLAASMRTDGPPIVLLAAVVLVLQIALSIIAVRFGVAAKRLLPGDPSRRQRLSPALGIWGGIVGALLVGGLMVAALTEGWLNQRRWAAHDMEGRALADVIEQMNHRELSVRVAALSELEEQSGPGIVPAVARTLTEAVGGGEAPIMDWAATVIRTHQRDSDAAGALPALKQLLTTHPGRLPDGHGNNGWDALAGMADVHTEALTLLLELAAHDEFAVRRAARGRLITYAAEDAERAKRWSAALRAHGESGTAVAQRRLHYVILQSRNFGPDLDAEDVDGWREPGRPHAWIGVAVQATRLTGLAVPDELRDAARRNLEPMLAAWANATPAIIPTTPAVIKTRTGGPPHTGGRPHANPHAAHIGPTTARP